MSLTGKTAIVTGASRGIGKEIAIRLGNEGMNIVLAARSLTDLEKVQQELNKLNIKSLAVATDISKEEEVTHLFDKAVSTFGQVDVAINNAGMGVFKPVEELSVTEWDKMMEVNVRGTFLLTKAVIPHMKQRKSGTIINVASDVSKRTFPNGSAYCASKYAQHAFADAVRKEVLPAGLKVSSIYPGLVDTYFGETEQGTDEKQEWLKPKDIANAVAYILQAPDYVVIDEITIHPTMQTW